MQRKPAKYTRYRPSARVLSYTVSTLLIPSVRMVVVGIKSSTQNDASGPRHALCPAASSHALSTILGQGICRDDVRFTHMLWAQGSSLLPTTNKQ